MANLRQTLYAWRDNEATKRGVELFRILPNQALDTIVKELPRTKEELTAIKGIKDAKYREFGKQILAMVDESTSMSGESVGVATNEYAEILPEGGVTEAPLSVSAYLDVVNDQLGRIAARVQGEIIQFKTQGSAVYATMKDTKDESVLSIFMWLSDYALLGVDLAEGMEVIVEGRSEVYKPTGRLSFRASTMELVGEGALKKAYDALRKKLDSEGVFLPEKKRALPEYPQKIGLITSKQGAVIHDFLNNLGKFGYAVRFTDARVEGIAAVKELLAAIAYFKTREIDVLVMIRGGGSLESLQAFNNEHIVRAIAEFPVPTIVAIGHDKDVPLAQLAADHAPSTPTAATALLNDSWEEGVHAVRYFTKDIMGLYHEELWKKRDELRSRDMEIRRAFTQITELFAKVSREFSSSFLRVERALTVALETLRALRAEISTGYTRSLKDLTQSLSEYSRMLQLYNPLRQLKLGYSILTRDGKVMRSITEMPPETSFEARLSDGTIEAQVVRKK